ncbi:MAG: hypothetical protein SGI77_15905 [Pirellulaceae bacterium]|nr:hypothetical protein [Pirellulaceae bacterium]
MDANTKKAPHRVRNGEAILCKVLNTVNMIGSERLRGCPMYESIDS